MTAGEPAAVVARGLHKNFKRKTGETVHALQDISIDVPPGSLSALVGPDGAGKTTLIRLIAGLMVADAGSLHVMGLDVAGSPQAVQDRIAYMPQRFGLYEDLSVQQNLDLYADLHGIGRRERTERYARLLEMTALARFTGRLAGKLSGGMKQKLGLACTLIGSPDLLLLDEPTVGVDPLSRRELWEIVEQLVHDQNLTVLMATSYLDEAERCEQAFVMREGRLLAQGRPSEVTALAADRSYRTERSAEPPRRLQSRLLDAAAVVDAVPEAGHVHLVLDGDAAGVRAALGDTPIEKVAPRFEDGFMMLLRRQAGKTTISASATAAEPAVRSDPPPDSVPNPPPDSVPAIAVSDLVRKFGDFTAVDHVSFRVARGEVFGLLGPNGAGKTTTFRMLCGLLPATGGTLRVAGVDLRHGRASARQHVGYVAQKFSLYGQLSVAENLEFFGAAYGLRNARRRERVDWALRQFELTDLKRLPTEQLPGGYKQRLAMAAALLHEPQILFLDEPTSGADPLARREFWQRITALADGGVTVIVTTHFMEEAEYCDRIVILDSGQLLVEGTPAEVRGHAPQVPGRETTMEDAFIAIVDAHREKQRAAA